MKEITARFRNPSTTLSLSRKPRPNQAPPSTQFGPVLATSFSNPDPATGRRQPRSFNLETLSPDHGSRSVDHGPMCLELGPRTVVQGSGKVAGKVLTVDLWGRFAKLLI